MNTMHEIITVKNKNFKVYGPESENFFRRRYRYRLDYGGNRYTFRDRDPGKALEKVKEFLRRREGIA